MFKVLVLIVCVAVALCLTHGMPTPDEERYLDKEYNREFMNWLKSLQYPQQQFGNGNNNPCKYYAGNLIPAMPKRNSELINSLLSLPKSMNDAGK